MLIMDEALDVYLTVRETEILELVAVGLSAKEIAQRVAIAPRTVERHIENIRLKMRARNRAHLVTRAIASGLIGSSMHFGEPMLFTPAQLGDSTWSRQPAFK